MSKQLSSPIPSRVRVIFVWLLSLSHHPLLRVCGGETTIFPIYKQEESMRNAKSKEVHNYMNVSVNPCEDFYEYSCGNWHKYHSPPAGGGKDNVETLHTILEHKVDKDLLILLDENVTIEDSSDARRLKIFYKSCLDAKQGEILHQQFVSDLIKANGGFPAVPGSNWMAHHHNYDWQHIVAVLRLKYGLNILIGMEVDNNFQTMEENSLYLQEPSTLLPRHLCNAKVTQSIDVTDHQYDVIEQQVAENLRAWLSMNKEEALHVAADMVTFEHDLCRAMYVDEQDEVEEDFIGSAQSVNRTKAYPRKNLHSFTHEFNNTLQFNTIVMNSFGVAVTKPVFMKSPKYFEQLVRVIEDTEEYNKTVVANYIMYQTLTHFNFPRNDTPRSRPSYCLAVVKKYFPHILGAIYKSKYANHMDKITEIFEELKKIFYDAFENHWIHDGTGRLGKKRLGDMTLHFPSYDQPPLKVDFARNDFWNNLRLIMGQIKDSDVSRLLSAYPPQPMDEVEAYETRMVYRPYQNRIDMGWGLLQAPYYQHFLPRAMAYAVIGHKLAHTMATAFDDKGWSAENKDRKNWDTQTAVEYYKKANCFTQQIGNYLNNDPDSFHNVTKSRQLIAQSIGVSMAFNAYLDWLNLQSPSNDQETLIKETLPEFGFTNTQLFFIAFAQAHCEARKKPKKPEPKLVLSPLSKHSMTRYEVNGPLMNFLEFAREFHCPIGSEMNAADKCIIY
ncbi:neprilysin-4 [Stomoxys calcitrans]|uniref:neprilysin-4 n=1 Tax=Stomoxys calcitrans TaxID=35570 RepID=UPI0027E25E28|nr:neprilysin-4 [Stomoxys calcitrans]